MPSNRTNALSDIKYKYSPVVSHYGNNQVVPSTWTRVKDPESGVNYIDPSLLEMRQRGEIAVNG